MPRPLSIPLRKGEFPLSQGFQPPSGVFDHRVGFALFLDEEKGV
jgi:hypothetical protein